MSLTISQAFEIFSSNLEITNKQQNLVSSRRTNVVNSISEKITLHPQKSLLIGSYDRDTLIRYLSESDVDILIILHYGENKDWNNSFGAIKVLDRFKEILDLSFPTVEKRRDRNCICMKYSEFTLDVVPAFLHDEGYFTIPDANRGLWIKTNPIKFAEYQTNINKLMHGTYKPLIKMVKAWNRNVGWPIKSFHLECIMNNRYSNYTQGYTFSSMLKIFFDNLPQYLQNPSYDPITGDRVDTYLDNVAYDKNKRRIAIEKAKKASIIASMAYDEEQNYPSEALSYWKQLLGEFFPNV